MDFPPFPLPPVQQGLLTSLQHLKLDGNSMPHLALPPPFKTPDGKDHSLHWTKRWHRERKKEVGCKLFVMLMEMYTTA